MMKKIIFLVLVFGIFAVDADAQIFKKQKERAEERAKKRAENKAQNKVDRKVDEAVDEAFENIGNLFKKKKKKKANEEQQENEEENEENQESTEIESDFLQKMMGNASPAELGIPDQYQFSTYVEGTMTYINKKGKEEKTPFNYLFADEGKYFGYQMSEDQITAIMDWDSDKMVSIMEEEKMATVIDWKATLEYAQENQTNSEEETDITSQDLPEITKTGKTKTIAGYECEQYLVDSDDMNGEIWRTPDLEFYSFMNMGMEAQQMMGGKKNKLPEEYTQLMSGGFVMEGTFTDKEDGSKTIMIVNSISKKTTTINLSDYRLMDTSGFFKR